VLVLVLMLVLLLLAARLLAWSCLRGLDSLICRALQLDEGDLTIDEMNGHEIMELLLLCGAHLEGLDTLLLGHWLPNTVYLLTSSPPPPWHAPWGLYKTLLLPVLAVCSCDAASSWGLRG